MSTCAVAKLDTRKRGVDSAMRSAATVAILDISERCADNVKSLLASQVPRTAVARVLAKAVRAVEALKCCCCGQVGHRGPDCPRRNERCSFSGKSGHLSQVCRSSGGNANARVVEVEPVEPEEEREIQHVWALSVYDTSGFPLGALSVCDNSNFPSGESGYMLNMIKDSGAEEHVVSLADWNSLGEPVMKLAQVRLRSATGDDMGVSGSFMVRGWCDNQMVELTALVATRAERSLCSATNLVNAGYSIEMRPTQSVLRRSGGGRILLQRCGKRDFLSIRVRKSCEINAITFSTMKREVQSLKSELRALRTGHLSSSEVRLPWT